MGCGYNKPNCACIATTPTSCIVHEGELPAGTTIEGCKPTLDSIIEALDREIIKLREKVNKLESEAKSLPVIDSLDDTSTDKALSARQGNLLNVNKADKKNTYTKNQVDQMLKIAGTTDSYSKEYIDTSLNKKVDKIDGKGLSTNDFTDEYKSYIDSYLGESSGSTGGGNVTVVDSLTSTSKTNALSANQGYLLNKNKADKTEVVTLDALKVGLDSKVDVELGKKLTTNDFTNAYKTKLDSIEANAKSVTIIDNLTSNKTDAALSANAGATLQNSKQDKLVSGTNIKTINEIDITGEGDISIPIIPVGVACIWTGDADRIPDGWVEVDDPLGLNASSSIPSKVIWIKYRP